MLKCLKNILRTSLLVTDVVSPLLVHAYFECKETIKALGWDGRCYSCCVIFLRVIRNNTGYDVNSNQYEISLYIFITSSNSSVIFKNNKVMTMCQIT